MKKNRPNFTHFGSLPFIRQQYRKQLSQLQSIIADAFQTKNLHKTLKVNNPNLFHLTLSMLTIPHQSTRTKVQKILQQKKEEFASILGKTRFTTDKIRYFTFKNRGSNKNQIKNVNVIYLDLKKDDEFKKISRLTDQLIRVLIKEEIVTHQELKQMYIEYNHNTNMFSNNDPHITLFRCENLLQDQDFLQCFSHIENAYEGKYLQCDYIDISTRFDYDLTNFYTPLYRIYLNDDNKKESNSIITQKQSKYKQKIEQKSQKNIE